MTSFIKALPPICFASAVILIVSCGVTEGPSLLSGDTTPVLPAVTITNGQAAGVVIGQTDLISGGSGSATNQLAGPIGNPLVQAGKLYIPDNGNSRILIFSSVPATPGPSADVAIATTTGDLSLSGQTVPGSSHSPEGIAISPVGSFFAISNASGDDDIAFMGWNTVPTTNVAANFYQSNTGSNGFPQGQVHLGVNPHDVGFAGNKMLVSDGNGNRVMIYNSAPAASEASADGVLGQTNFTNLGSGSGTNAAGAFMNNPNGIWSDGTKLYVADTGNNRILGWNTIPTATKSPDFILDTTSGVAMSGPTFIFGTSNPAQFFACDTGNHRVLVWNSLPTTSHAAPDRVLGQANFTSVTANAGGSTSAVGLSSPEGVYVKGTQIFVNDTGNNRALIFNGN